MRPLNIGLVGYGAIGRVHAMAYRAIPFYYGLPAGLINIVGVATTKPETAEKAAREIGCGFWTADYHELLARDDVDVIDCCTPNNSHEEVLVAAAGAGKHIYCEKPLAMNVAEAQRIVEAVAEAGVKGQMTFNFRFYPAILRAKQLIDPDKPLSWRLRKELTGGGALFDLGSHILDLIYYLLGDFGSVQAVLDTLIKERPVAGAGHTEPVDVDDIALLHARMADGTLGLVEISRMGTGLTNDLVIEIFGDKGAIRFDVTDPNWLEVYDVRDKAQPMGGMRGFRKLETVSRYEGQKAPDWTATPDFVRAHAECGYRFLRAIWDNGPTSPSFTDGLHIQEVMEAALRSSEEQRWVGIAEVRQPG